MKLLFRHDDWVINLRDVVALRYDGDRVHVRFFHTNSDVPFEVLDRQVFEDMFTAWEALFVVPAFFQAPEKKEGDE
ncbi:MAG: hypothetical protein ACYTEQ_01575 [Planctomycetota bacterium]|jgi:hypothetical protein